MSRSLAKKEKAGHYSQKEKTVYKKERRNNQLLMNESSVDENCAGDS